MIKIFNQNLKMATTTFIILDFLHLLFTITWIGGMFFYAIVLSPSISLINPKEKGKFMEKISKRFSILAWLSILILIITGILLGITDPRQHTELYKSIFLMKLIIVLLMVIIGVILGFILAPRLKIPKKAQKIQKKIALLALINLILGITVVFLVALLKVV